MSYSVNYAGEFLFKHELTDEQFNRLDSLYQGYSGRRIKSSKIKLPELASKYKQLNPTVVTESLDNSFTTCINRDETGLCSLDDYLIPVTEFNVIILWMREVFPDFELTGCINACGEDGSTFQYYVGEDGFVYERDVDAFRKCKGKLTINDDGISLDIQYVISCSNKMIDMTGDKPSYCPICGGEIES